MKNLRISSEPFFNPTPSGDEPVKDEEGGGGGKEIAPDPIEEVTKEIVALAEKYAAGAIDAVTYVDQILPWVAMREDRMKHHHPQNRDVVKKIFDATSVRYSTILRDFDYGEIVEKFYPLSRLSEDAKKTRALVRDAAAVRFAHRPFLDVITSFDQTATRPIERLRVTGQVFRYNQEHTNRCARLMLDILSLPEVQSDGDLKKRRGLAALVILESIAKAKMMQDIDDLLKKPGSVVSRGAEEFWEHHLLGKLKDEGIVFCRNYVEQIRDYILRIANDEYGDSGGRIINAWGALSSATVSTAEARRYVIEQLMSGKIQAAERALLKISRTEQQHFVPEQAVSTAEQPALEETQKAPEKKGNDEKEAQEFLTAYANHLFLNVESMLGTHALEFVFIGISQPTAKLDATNVDTQKLHVCRIQLGKSYSMFPFYHSYSSTNLAQRIRFGGQYYHDMTAAIPSDEVVIPRRVNGAGALIDVGIVQVLSKQAIHEAVMSFAKSDRARMVWEKQCDDIVHYLEGASPGNKIMRNEYEDIEREALEAAYHHVFIRPLRKKHGAKMRGEFSAIHILGMLSMEDIHKGDRIRRAKPSAGTLKNPVLLYTRAVLSGGGRLVHRATVVTSSFSRIAENLREGGTADMGKYDALTPDLAKILVDQYTRK